MSHVTRTAFTAAAIVDAVVDSMAHKWMSLCLSHVTYEWGSSHIWMSHVTHMNESRHTYKSVTSHIWMSRVTRTAFETAAIVDAVVNPRAHIRMSLVWVISHVNESRYTYEWEGHTSEWVTSHIWISHVTCTAFKTAAIVDAVVDSQADQISMWWDYMSMWWDQISM